MKVIIILVLFVYTLSQDPQGCCNRITNACSDQLNPIDCSNSGGISQGANTKCTTATGGFCGSCCTAGVGCVNSTLPNSISCSAPSSSYQGDGSVCNGTLTCSLGACNTNTTCSVTTNATCSTLNGIFGGVNSTCPITAACCLNNVCSVLSNSTCLSLNGTFNGLNSTCSSQSCLATGSCCTNKTCSIVTNSTCLSSNGTYNGDNTNCTNQTCSTGSCCSPDRRCSVVSNSKCLSSNGRYLGDNTVCTQSSCNPICIIATPAQCTNQSGLFKEYGANCTSTTCISGLIIPTLSCNINYGNGTCRAFLGYNNTFNGTLGLACNESSSNVDNLFIPDNKCRGQPTIFLPGSNPNVFSVLWNCTALTFRLDTSDLVISDGTQVVSTCTGTCCLSTTKRCSSKYIFFN